MINDFLIDYLNEEAGACLSNKVSLHNYTVNGNDVSINIALNIYESKLLDIVEFNVDLIDLMAFIYKKVKPND